MGNMQFNLDKTFDTIPCNNTGDAEMIVKAINTMEGKYQNELEEMYNKLDSIIIKRMRRAVPVTGQKFDWGRPDGIIK